MAEEIKISKQFIEEELPSAPPLYVSVYLMSLGTKAPAAEVAKKLNVTESDVLRAWAYWKDRGFLQPEENAVPKKIPLASQRPDYSPAELAEYQKHEEIQQLFQSAEQKLGKLLSQQDMSLLFGLHDWLGLPLDVIDLLLSYCTENGHKGIRYMEKVALGWAEEGIDTVEKAAEHIAMRKTGFRTILRAFGQGNRLPVAAEEDYMKKWLGEYALPLDVVKTACERTVLQTGKASFPYADSILRHWKAAGVKTLEDIAVQDQAFAAKKSINENRPAAKEPPKAKKNRFINYTQSEWDFEEIERLEREKRKKW